MMSINRVILVGNLARDPELRSTAGGATVARFPVAVSKKWKARDGELKSETGFFTVAVWSSLAQNCSKFLAKGAPVLVEGRLRAGSFLGKDGTRRFFTEVVGDNVSFLGTKGDRRYSPPSQGEVPKTQENQASEEDQEPATSESPEEEDGMAIPF